MVLANLKEIIKKDIQKAGIPDETGKESSHTLLQIKAKKLLAGFFVMMLMLTILSRAADSITVAQVVTQSPKGNMLTFTASGTGKIVAGVKKYVKLPEGLEVAQISVNSGQKVKKGDVLLTVDSTDLMGALKSAKLETDKLKNQMEQEGLSGDPATLSTQEKAKLLFENSKLDLVNAKEDYKEAKTDYMDAVAKKKESIINYKNGLTKNKKEIYQGKMQDYKSAKASYDSVSLSNADSLRTAQRSYDDAKADFQELNEIDSDIVGFMDQYAKYLGKDTTLTREASEGLLQMAYEDDSDTYEKHESEVHDLETKLAKAKEDYSEVPSLYRDNNGKISDVTGYQTALRSALRAVNDAEDELASLIKKDNNIRSELSAYVSAVQTSDINRRDDALHKMKQYILGSSGYKKHLKAISTAQTKVTYTADDLDSTKKKNDIALSIEQDKLDKIKQDLNSIQDGTYDYDSAMEEEKQKIETAGQETDTKKQAMKTAKAAVSTAIRSKELAKFDYEQATLQDGITKSTQKKQERAINLRVKALQMDMERKQQVVNNLRQIQNNKGKILAPVTGTIDSITLEAGKKSTADNSVAINTSGYSVVVNVPKEQGDYVSVGDEMQLTAKGKKDTIKVDVDGIRYYTDDNNNELTEITAAMPKGKYIPGATLDAEITKNSDLYDSTIPLTAVREDQKGSFCLITQEKKTVLGKELTAVRVAVKVIEKDSENAAVDSALSKDDNVIISGSKNISEGDRVRLKQK